MSPIHFHPDGPNGSSPIPYPREVTALDDEKRAGEVTVNAAAPGGIQQTYCAHEPE